MNDCIAGVDEAGRGPLAGPVVAAAVILDALRPIDGLRDSKRLSARRREVLAEQIRQSALAWSIGWSSVAEIDDLNILQASLLAMRRAVASLSIRPARILVDGAQTTEFSVPSEARVGGDGLEPCISAASILAKTARDRHMLEMHRDYPEFGFDQHKGYPTRTHLAALGLHGASPIHRRSFAPVRRVLLRQAQAT